MTPTHALLVGAIATLFFGAFAFSVGVMAASIWPKAARIIATLSFSQSEDTNNGN